MFLDLGMAAVRFGCAIFEGTGDLLEPCSDGIDGFERRLAAMERVFGKADEVVLHAVIPFQFGYEAGGLADVVSSAVMSRVLFTPLAS